MLPLIIAVKGLCAFQPESSGSQNLQGEQLKIGSQSSYSEQTVLAVCMCIYVYNFPPDVIWMEKQFTLF
jgi:hypothetical protein